MYISTPVRFFTKKADMHGVRVHLSMDCICGMSGEAVILVTHVSGRAELESACKSRRTWSATNPSMWNSLPELEMLPRISCWLGGVFRPSLVSRAAYNTSDC